MDIYCKSNETAGPGKKTPSEFTLQFVRKTEIRLFRVMVTAIKRILTEEESKHLVIPYRKFKSSKQILAEKFRRLR